MVVERHGSFSEPVLCGRHFTMVMTLDATFKERGRSVLEEICVYDVKDGKVAFEQFFF